MSTPMPSISTDSFNFMNEKDLPRPKTLIADKAAEFDTITSERKTIEEVDPQLLEKVRKDFEIDALGGPSNYLGGYASEFISDSTDNAIVLRGIQIAIEDLKEIFYPVVEEVGDFLADEMIANDTLGRIVLKEMPKFAYKADLATQDPNSDFALSYENLMERAQVLALAARDKSVIRFFKNESVKTMQNPTGRIMKSVKGVSEQWSPEDSPKFIANYRTISRADRNPREEQKLIRNQLGAVLAGEYDGLFTFSEYQPEADPGIEAEIEAEPGIVPQPFIETQLLTSSEMQELKFQLLPGDTNLRDLAETIYEESSDVEKVRVDPERVQILEEMRTLFGEDHCYFARGESSGETYEDESGEPISGDFIVLVMQHHNATGHVEREDALAISPIARRHAVFYMRQDVSEDLSWREVYGLSKKAAIDLGTRKLKFVAPEGIDVYTAMKEKLFALATCRAEDFHSDLRYDSRKNIYVPRSKKIRAAITQSAAIAA